MYDVIALGELLIDFTQNGVSEQGNPIFEANPGGAPCNVLSMLNNLGRKISFIGVVGDDQFGITLKKTLNNIGIDTSHLYTHKKVNTTLAFVHTLVDGDRDFSFYRNLGADMMSKVTAMGCTIDGIVAAFAAINQNLNKAAYNAMTLCGYAGQTAAAKSKGNGSMMINFLDELYLITTNY